MTEKEIEIAEILLEAIIETKDKKQYNRAQAILNYDQFISAAHMRQALVN